MGYFSNGTEGMDYAARYCDRCIHGTNPMEQCAVWEAHLLHNYDDAHNGENILDILIPRNQRTGENEQCRMFIKA